MPAKAGAANAYHQNGSVKNDTTVPIPTIRVISGAFNPYWIATMEPPICGAIAGPEADQGCADRETSPVIR